MSQDNTTDDLVHSYPDLSSDVPELDEAQKAELEKQLADLKAQYAPTYTNAPETIEDAIERILELELRLADLHRAAEIAVAVKDFSLIEGQMPEAEKTLETKIIVEYPQGTPNIVVYS